MVCSEFFAFPQSAAASLTFLVVGRQSVVHFIKLLNSSDNREKHYKMVIKAVCVLVGSVSGTVFFEQVKLTPI